MPETKRLKLRSWRASDLEGFAALNADPETMKYFPATLDRLANDAMATRFQSLIDEFGWGFWAVEEKESGAFIGFVGLNKPSAELPFSPCVEIGWRLSRDFWGKGYATEAANAALSFGFEHLSLEEIVSFTALSNQRSQKVMERLFMQRDPNDFDHPSLPLGHPLRRHCLYRLSKIRYDAP